jgi:hypothetical protein
MHTASIGSGCAGHSTGMLDHSAGGSWRAIRSTQGMSSVVFGQLGLMLAPGRPQRPVIGGRATQRRALPGDIGRRFVPTRPGNLGSRLTDLDPLPRLARHCPGKELGVHDLGQDLEALDDARPRAVEVGGAVHCVDVS